ncbi:MAG: hypothetical protein PVF47_18425 [Anaerolineae bacterium]
MAGDRSQSAEPPGGEPEHPGQHHPGRHHRRPLSLRRSGRDVGHRQHRSDRAPHPPAVPPSRSFRPGPGRDRAGSHLCQPGWGPDLARVSRGRRAAGRVRLVSALLAPGRLRARFRLPRTAGLCCRRGGRLAPLRRRRRNLAPGQGQLGPAPDVPRGRGPPRRPLCNPPFFIAGTGPGAHRRRILPFGGWGRALGTPLSHLLPRRLGRSGRHSPHAAGSGRFGRSQRPHRRDTGCRPNLASGFSRTGRSLVAPHGQSISRHRFRAAGRVVQRRVVGLATSNSGLELPSDPGPMGPGRRRHRCLSQQII